MRPLDNLRRQRRSIRLKGYDYTQPGAYFISIVSQDRVCLFGGIVEGTMQRTEAGHMVQSAWGAIPDHYPGIDVDAFTLMPNHVHGIIVVGAAPRGRPGPGDQIVRAAPRGRPGPGDQIVAAAPRGRPGPGDQIVAAAPRGRPDPGDRVDAGQARGPAPTRTLSVADVVQRLKTLTTKRYTDGVKQSGWPAFPARLWQRNYYEHIVRDEASLQRIREYIATNPARWLEDAENPAAQRTKR